jgi:hypothetical protein
MLGRFSSNAAANIVTGVGSMAFQLGLTALAARHFDRSSFSVWTLAFSMSALTPLFGVNLSSAVTRQLVEVANITKHRSISLVLQAARIVSRSLMLIAILGVACASYALYRHSPALEHIGAAAFVGASLVLTLGQLWQILRQPSFGWHYAHENNWPVAGIYSLVRVGALTCMWIAMRFLSGNLMAAALSVALGNWLGVAAAEYLFFSPQTEIANDQANLRAQVLETRRLALGFAIWSVGIAAIQYGLPPLMSVLGTPDYNAFYLAYSLNLVLVGMVGSVGSALLAPLARLRLQGRIQSLSRWLTLIPIACATSLIIGLLVLRVGMGSIIRFWSPGIADPSVVNSYLSILGFQTIARSMGIPFANVLSSVGRPMQLAVPTTLELLIGTCVAIPLGFHFGSQVFLCVVAAAGLIAAISTAVAAMWFEGPVVPRRGKILVHLCLVEAVALVTWYVLQAFTSAL